ncbi:3-hydroxybutyrate dehydrogenase [Devosia sp. A16]|uniref:3-hydroxybutyrate dehydrogenase n=1 Tax=Devosia sp. A16 TaxID=1736675 RepID=UPI0006D82D93|nr:3-hydroxybutyrate dehydrogenase [Devosia sp. A16]
MTEQKTALVTGALGGLGSAIAARLAADGFRIAYHDIVERSADDYFRADLLQPGAGEQLVADVIARYGRLDVLVNNAGAQKVAPVAEFARADWDLVRTLSLDASFECIKAAVPGMVERRWGRIVNIASAHGLIASPFKSAYTAAKHGLVGLTKSVALEVAEAGVTANAICPGYVRTPLVEKQIDDQMKVHGLSREAVIRDIMLASQPTRRFVEAEEVAGLASYLVSDAARSITGTTIAIDGGWTAR